MTDRRYVVECGNFLERRVGPAPATLPVNALTKREAAQRIVNEMDEAIAAAKRSRKRALRIVCDEKRKEAAQ